MLTLENWHYLNYKGHFYLCIQQKTNAFLDVYGRFCPGNVYLKKLDRGARPFLGSETLFFGFEKVPLTFLGLKSFYLFFGLTIVI